MRGHLVRTLTLLVCLVIATGAGAGHAGAATPAPTRDTVVIGMAQEPDTLGRFSVMSAARVLDNVLFAFIAPYNERWIRTPLLVASLPTLKNGLWTLSADGRMRIKWIVRRGFTWHDGRPVTALDFRFTYALLRNPRVPGISRFVLNKIDHVTVPDPGDPYTVLVQWNERYPFAGSLPFGEQVILPRHVLETPYLRSPETLPGLAYWRAPIGNGPYRFVEWVPGNHVIVEASSRFPGGTPRVRRLIFRFILDSGALQAAVISGDVDATEINNFGVREMVEIGRRAPGVGTSYTPSLRWDRLVFNMTDDWLGDRRVRHAIAHALDRETIVRTLFEGKFAGAHTWLAPRHPGANGRVRRYVYDQRRARELLADAGFTPGADGVLRDRSGRRVEMSLFTTAGSDVREQIAELVRHYLREVGIEVRIEIRPASVFFGVVTRRRQFPHLGLWSTLFSLESTGYEGFHSSQIPDEANNWEGFNAMGWRNSENDRLLEQIAAELDESRRVALLRRQQEVFAEDLPSLPLYFTMSLTTTRKDLRNVKPTGLFGSFLPWNAQEWLWQQ